MQINSQSKFFRVLSVLFSGICFYFGLSLNGNLGWLMWIAPFPILYISLYAKPGRAFQMAFLAYLIGWLSWFPYLKKVMPLPPAIMFTLILPLASAMIVIMARKICLISQHWFSAFAFPVLVTAFEYIVFIFSKDGTAASIAYTQSNNLYLIQVASVTGILGISFLISFFPSSLALIWFSRKNRKNSNTLTIITVSTYFIVIIFGLIRLNQQASGNPVPIAMISLDESDNRMVFDHDPAKKVELANHYLQELSYLADSGAKIILLPEKVIYLTDSTDSFGLQKFREFAANHQVQLIIGGAKQKNGRRYNNAWVISARGNLVADYQKVNLFEGEILDGFSLGNNIAVFNTGNMNEGVAICKDMDFQQFILGYSKKSPAILYVPAWDFVSDGWLHSRMAILRGVEGGFSLLRNARQGRLTISDWRGEVLAESNSETGAKTVLMGNISIKPHPTIYARAGDWFGTVCLFASAGFGLFLFSRKRKFQPDVRSMPE
jgi:apolipoprotein N-acyltransferase